MLTLFLFSFIFHLLILSFSSPSTGSSLKLTTSYFPTSDLLHLVKPLKLQTYLSYENVSNEIDCKETSVALSTVT